MENTCVLGEDVQVKVRGREEGGSSWEGKVEVVGEQSRGAH
jgi:hypothetical protein